MLLRFTITPYFWYLLGGLAVLAVLFAPDIASAQQNAGPIKSILYYIIMTLTGWLLWMGGALLDYGINAFVINFGINFNTQGVGVAVNELWVIVRDMFNILFIFGLVYIGFKMILNSDDSRTRSTLVSLIMAALLINFSLFITKFVVDFTNILASEVAVAGFQLVDDSGQPILAEDVNGDRRTVAVGDTFFRLMAITPEIFRVPDESATGEATGSTATWSYIFGIGIVNIIGAFAFGVGGIMLIIRFVALSVYMVLSPFMFLGWIFPGFQNMSRKYWSGFFKQAFYAPVYMIMIFFSATILNNFFAESGVSAGGGGGSMQNGGLGNLVGSNGFTGTVGDTVGTAASEFGGGLAPFILSCAFLIAAVQVAGKLSADGSATMAKVTGAVNSRVRGAVRGGARFGARNTLGYGMSYGVNRAGESARRRLNTRTANWAQGNAVQRWAARTTDTTLGAGLDRVASARVAGSETRAERRTRINSAQAGFNETQNQNQRRDAFNAGQQTGASDEQRQAAKKALKKMSTEELLALGPDVVHSPEVWNKLSSAQRKAITGSGTMTNTQIKAVGETAQKAMFDELKQAINKTGATEEELGQAIKDLSKAISNIGNDELVEVKSEHLKDQAVASKLSEKQLDTIRDSGNYTAEEFGDIKDARAKGLESVAKTGGVSGQRVPSEEFAQRQRENLVKGNVQDIGKLPPEVFMEPKMASLITPAMLQQRVRNGLSASDAQKIKENIEDYITKPGTPDRITKMWSRWSENTSEGGRFGF